MPDIVPPADLVDLKVGFLTAEQQVSALAAEMPSGSAIIAGQQATAEQQQRWDELHETLRTLAEQINDHPFITSAPPDKRVAARQAVTTAAKAQLAAASTQETADGAQ